MATGGFCIDCGHQVKSFAGLNACPQCGSHSVPCSHDAQVRVSVNWQELRVLVVWAENWARERVPAEGPTAPVELIHHIARRLEDQHPDRALQVPLTLAGEVRYIQDLFPGATVEGNDALMREVEQYRPLNEPPPPVDEDKDEG